MKSSFIKWEKKLSKPSVFSFQAVFLVLTLIIPSAYHIFHGRECDLSSKLKTYLTLSWFLLWLFLITTLTNWVHSSTDILKTGDIKVAQETDHLL